MKEFRLVLYMNGSEAIDFWGGRAAASPLAYYFHINKSKRKVFLGGSFAFIGLGKYKGAIKAQLESDTKPLFLPKRLNISGEPIILSNKAYIYQNNDPLFTQLDHEVYWQATINTIGHSFTKQEEEQRYTLDALRIGLDTYYGCRRLHQPGKKRTMRALVSQLVRWEQPVKKDACPWKIYDGQWRKRNFWGIMECRQYHARMPLCTQHLLNGSSLINHLKAGRYTSQN